MLERFTSPADVHLSVPVTELVVGDAARLRYLGVQDHGAGIWQIALVRATVGRDATLRSSAVALGGDYARLRSEALLSGAGASSEMVAVYFANEHQMLDFRTLQDHDAPHTTSELLFKGAVEDEAESVYSGLIRLQPGGPAGQRHADQPQPRPLRRARRPSRSPTSRSSATTCAAPTPRRSARSTPTSSTTWRRGACRPTWPSG